VTYVDGGIKTIAAADPNRIGASLTRTGGRGRTMPERTTLSTLSETPHAEVFETRRPRTVRLQLDADERVPNHTREGTDVVVHPSMGGWN
jgi:hypothetical protein